MGWLAGWSGESNSEQEVVVRFILVHSAVLNQPEIERFVLFLLEIKTCLFQHALPWMILDGFAEGVVYHCGVWSHTGPLLRSISLPTAMASFIEGFMLWSLA